MVWADEAAAEERSLAATPMSLKLHANHARVADVPLA